MQSYRYIVTLVTTEKLNESTRLGLADIITDVVEAEDIDLADVVSIEGGS